MFFNFRCQSDRAVTHADTALSIPFSGFQTALPHVTVFQKFLSSMPLMTKQGPKRNRKVQALKRKL